MLLFSHCKFCVEGILVPFISLKVADLLSKEIKVSAVYSSDLKRAFETAQIIATTCGGLEVLCFSVKIV